MDVNYDFRITINNFNKERTVSLVTTRVFTQIMRFDLLRTYRWVNLHISMLSFSLKIKLIICYCKI